MDLDYYFDDDTCEMVAIAPNEQKPNRISYAIKPSMDELAKEASRLTKIHVRAIMGAKRDRRAVRTRFALWYVIRQCYTFSYPAIGRKFKRHHSSVMDGVTRAEYFIDNPQKNTQFCKLVDALFEFIDAAACRRG